MKPTYQDEVELPDGSTHTVSASTPEDLDTKTNAFLEGETE